MSRERRATIARLIGVAARTYTEATWSALAGGEVSVEEKRRIRARVADAVLDALLVEAGLAGGWLDEQIEIALARRELQP